MLTAAGHLLQEFSRGQGGSLASDRMLLCPPCLTVVLGQAPALGIRAMPDTLLWPGRVKGGGSAAALPCSIPHFPITQSCTHQPASCRTSRPSKERMRVPARSGAPLPVKRASQLLKSTSS